MNTLNTSVKEKEATLQIGTLLFNGKYRIDQFISSGGFGNTYIATDLAFNEKVAIKELFIEGICGRTENTTNVTVSLSVNQYTFNNLQEKFRKEARRIRKLSNPHIVKVHDLFDENGTSYYVMDFIEGESLSALLKRTAKPMTEDELMHIVPQVLDALECIHREGIWHLDLKPGNIMVDARGNAKLIDFGASKQIKSSKGEANSTSSAMAYTPGYAPSEQMEQKMDKFGPWTDLYALGATMFNLLTMLQPPSPSDIDENPQEALMMPECISSKISGLIVWLMKPNRTIRPQSVADVKNYLVNGTATVATPPEELLRTSPGPSQGGETQSPKAPVPNGVPLGVPGSSNAPVPNSSPSGKKASPKAQAPNSSPSGKNTTVAPATPAKPAVDPVGKTVNINEPGSYVEYEDDSIDKKPKSKGKLYAIIGAIVVLVGVAVFAFTKMGGSTKKERVSTDTVAIAESEKMDSVTKMEITVNEGPDNMRKYKFTGKIDSNGLPQGHGKASFEKFGEVPAATYTGNFVDGICDDNSGKAVLEFDNEDRYEGTFKHGYYDEGTYFFKFDNTYFKGTFKNANPLNGTLYNASGIAIGKYEKGNEIRL